jgi:hypothetical protein
VIGTPTKLRAAQGREKPVIRYIHPMRTAFLIPALVIVACVARADDLDVVVDAKVSAESRGQAYERLAAADFPAIAAKLATLIGSHPVHTGLGPRTEQPWSEPGLSEGDRIGCTLRQLWSRHMKAAKTRGQHIDLMLAILEDASIGAGRRLAMAEISSRLHFGRAFADPSLPPLDGVLPRLDRLASDAKQANDFRRPLIAILFEHGDPNQYLELAIRVSSLEDTLLGQAEAFRFCTPTFESDRFTEANRKKYVRHCFELLEKTDDRRTGTGYFLAMHVGEFLGIPPVSAGQGSFAPDQGLPRYQGGNGLSESFFQDTVNNALKWWDENKIQY